MFFPVIFHFDKEKKKNSPCDFHMEKSILSTFQIKYISLAVKIQCSLLISSLQT